MLDLVLLFSVGSHALGEDDGQVRTQLPTNCSRCKDSASPDAVYPGIGEGSHPGLAGFPRCCALLQTGDSWSKDPLGHVEALWNEVDQSNEQSPVWRTRRCLLQPALNILSAAHLHIRMPSSTLHCHCLSFCTCFTTSLEARRMVTVRAGLGCASVSQFICILWEEL